MCALCSNEDETLEHLLFSCPVSCSVWKTSYKWLGISTALPHDCWQHFLLHGAELKASKQRKGMISIWLAITWSIWLGRNKIIFDNLQMDTEKIVELAQQRAWTWLRAKAPSFHCSFYEWLVHPTYCLNTLWFWWPLIFRWDRVKVLFVSCWLCIFCFLSSSHDSCGAIPKLSCALSLYLWFEELLAPLTHLFIIY